MSVMDDLLGDIEPGDATQDDGAHAPYCPHAVALQNVMDLIHEAASDTTMSRSSQNLMGILYRVACATAEAPFNVIH